MKKLWFVAFLLSVVLQSCDKIDSPYSETVTIAGGDTVQKVLLEEFTGHTCLNCPDAHAQGQALHNIYKDHLVIVSIHAGFYARTENHPDSSFRYDFTTPTGNAIFNAFIPSNEPFPTGLIQRSRNDQNIYPTKYVNWAKYVAHYDSLKPNVFLKIDNTFNSGAKTISCTVTAKFLKDQQDSLSLCLFYTQDSMINWQKNGTFNDPHYVHRHVLRGSLNGTWGDYIGAAFTNGQSLIKSYTGSPIQSDAVPEHLSVVAILFKSNTKQVVQVEEQKLLP